MDSFVFISILALAYGSFKNSFAMITSLSQFYFRIRRFILLVQTKKGISMNYGSSTSSWKPWRWVRCDWIIMMRDKCIISNLNPLTKFTSRSRSTDLKISSHWISFKWSWRPYQFKNSLQEHFNPIKLHIFWKSNRKTIWKQQDCSV